MMFRAIYDGEDCLGVWRDDNHMVIKWSCADVYFSFAQRGNAISAHFSAAKTALRYIRYAIDDFCKWAFNVMPWCTMILACVKRESVSRLIKDSGFRFVLKIDGHDIFARCDQWAAQ
jgi:hypothetical protein